MAPLDNLVSDAALGVVLPPLFNLITTRVKDTNAKKRISWALCVAITLCLAAGRGYFTPAYTAWMSRGDGVTALQALWGAGTAVAATFGTLVVFTSNLFDKFYQPEKKIRSAAEEAEQEESAPDNPPAVGGAPVVTVPQMLQSKRAEVVANSPTSNPQTATQTAPAPPTQPGTFFVENNAQPPAFDLDEGAPVLDVETPTSGAQDDEAVGDQEDATQ